jgi:CRISPR-associated protein Csx10
MIAALTLTLTQPTLMGDKARSDFLRSTHRYLPGSTVRGAFAAAWIARYGTPGTVSATRRKEFLDLFEGGVRFAPLFLDRAFVPLSVRRHKYQVTDACARAEIDLATDPDAPRYCADCGSDLETRHGLPSSPQVQRRTSVHLKPDGVAVRGDLFFRDTLTAGQSFAGHLSSPDPALLTRLAELGPLRLGGRRTTHGRATVTIDTAAGAPTIQRRPDGWLILRLRGPAVFVDDRGRPIDHPNPRELREPLGTDIAVERSWARWEHHGGWHAASGLPKPGELAVAGGSTYLLRPTATVGDQALTALTERGIGLRRHEGFGDLGGPYRPALSPRQLRDVERSYAAVLTLTTDDEQWVTVMGMLTELVDGDGSAAAGLRRWAGSAGAAFATAGEHLLRLLDEPSDVLGFVVADWQGRYGRGRGK